MHGPLSEIFTQLRDGYRVCFPLSDVLEQPGGFLESVSSVSVIVTANVNTEMPDVLIAYSLNKQIDLHAVRWLGCAFAF